MTPETNTELLELILKIQAGDTLAREDFITEYRPFVARTAMNLCKRSLEWGNSDELSIALVAFNSALDSYDPDKRVPFLPYARVVIQNRLKDLFRKKSRLRMECPLETETDDGQYLSPADIQSAWEDFRNRTIEDERRDELAEYEEMLGKYGIDFETLAEASPKHTDSRQTLFRVAELVARHEEMMNQLLDKKQLPISELVLKTGVNRKTLERGRKFIIATALVFYYPMDFPYLRSYITPVNSK